MKKIAFTILMFLMLIHNAQATEEVGFIKKINYLDQNLTAVGLLDYPPFSSLKKGEIMEFESAFLAPLRQVMDKYGVEIEFPVVFMEDSPSVKMLLIETRAGTYQLFLGANSNTKLFTGLELVYPATVNNPIHLITLPEKQDRIKTFSDLEKLKGIACSSEYFSDFIVRKFKEMNVQFVDTPYDAYEQLFTGKADYLLGGLYYNRIMASRLGVDRYLAYSKNPLYKMPVFLALSPVMPKVSEYKNTLREELMKPEFSRAVKEEIVRMVEKEIVSNEGIVPPSFAKYQTEEQEEKFDEEEEFDEEDNNGVENNLNSGHIIEKEEHKRTMEEVLEGL